LFFQKNKGIRTLEELPADLGSLQKHKDYVLLAPPSTPGFDIFILEATEDGKYQPLVYQCKWSADDSSKLLTKKDIKNCLTNTESVWKYMEKTPYMIICAWNGCKQH